MRSRLKMAMLFAGLTLASQAAAQVTFYQYEEFGGGNVRVDATVPDFVPLGFNDRASSAVVEQGRWEVCEDAGFRGRCTILSPGRYPSLAPLGFNNRISSARPIQFQEPYPVAATPPPVPAYDYRRRPNEHVFEVPVHSVRAVVGPPEQRCWVERQQVVESAQSAPTSQVRLSARSSAACSGTRSAAVAGRTSRRRAVRWREPPSAPMWEGVREACTTRMSSAAPLFRVRRVRTSGMSCITSTASSTTCSLTARRRRQSGSIEMGNRGCRLRRTRL